MLSIEELSKVDKRPEIGDMGTPVGLVNEMLDTLPVEVFESSTTMFLEPCFGSGTFIFEVIKRLRSYGHSMENIEKRVVGVESDLGYFNEVSRKLSNYNFRLINADVLQYDFNNMDFDSILGNPPFTLASTSSTTIAGTSGNTTYYRKFIDFANSVKKEDGVVALVVPRSGINWTHKKYGVSMFEPTTSSHWKFDCGYFLQMGQNKDFVNVSKESIVNKVYTGKVHYKFSHAISHSFKKKLEVGDVSLSRVEGGTYGLINTQTSNEGKVYGYILENSFVPEGPKVVFKGLESKNSYCVEVLPHKVGSACTLYFDTVEEAEAALKFIQNSKVVDYLMKFVNEKAKGLMFRYMKSFDLTQIVTGYEYPREFGLTQEEIDLIESTIS